MLISISFVLETIVSEHKVGEEDGAKLIVGETVGGVEGALDCVGELVRNTATLILSLRDTTTPMATAAVSSTRKITASIPLVLLCFHQGGIGSAYPAMTILSSSSSSTKYARGMTATDESR